MAVLRPRPSPHIYQVGIIVAIVSITSFFAALSVAYYSSVHQQIGGAAPHMPGILWVSTAILIVSSAAFEAARYSIRRAHVLEYRQRLEATVVLGIAFLCLQLVSWWVLVQRGIHIQGNPRGSAFYTFSGLHGLHLSGGLIWLWYLLKRSAFLNASLEQNLRRHRMLAGAVAAYWHFMGVLWLFLFTLLAVWSA